MTKRERYKELHNLRHGYRSWAKAYAFKRNPNILDILNLYKEMYDFVKNQE